MTRYNVGITYDGGVQYLRITKPRFRDLLSGPVFLIDRVTAGYIGWVPGWSRFITWIHRAGTPLYTRQISDHDAKTLDGYGPFWRYDDPEEVIGHGNRGFDSEGQLELAKKLFVTSHRKKGVRND